MTGFDIAILILVGLGAITGFMRGLVQEVFALAAWVLALVAIRNGGSRRTRETPRLTHPVSRVTSPAVSPRAATARAAMWSASTALERVGATIFSIERRL